MKHAIKNLLTRAGNLKDNQQVLIFLIGLDLVMAIASNIVDWPWMMSVEWYLRPFAPICSLFPGTLAIWFVIYFIKKRVPNWFTSFIFIGIISYGIMAQIYYPVYMTVFEFDWRLPGNMLWVAIYASQSLIIASELKPVKLYQFALIIGYYLFKDYSDRYLGSFIDALRPGFPEVLKDFFGLTMLLFHLILFSFTAWVTQKRRTESTIVSDLQPEIQV